MDSSNQFLVVLFMALCPEDLSSIKVGKLSPYTYAATPNPRPSSFSSWPGGGGLHTSNHTTRMRNHLLVLLLT